MPKKFRFAIGAGLIVASIAYLIVTAVRNTAEYYLTVNEVKARQPELTGQMLRIAGRVAPNTISWNPSTLTLKFAMSQPAAAGPSDKAPAVTAVAATTASPALFQVICRGQPRPDMFAPGRDVIVEGQLGRDGVIEARQVLTSCPSKYIPKQPK